MENAKKHFAISELAKEFDVSKRHIRFCEEKGLISPRITKLNRRIYSRYDRARLKLIFHCVLIGYSQDQIVELIGIPDAGLNEIDQIKKGLEYGERMIEKLDIRRNELSFHQRTSIINEIKLLREYIKEIKAIPFETSDESEAKPLIQDKKSKDEARKPVKKIKPEVERRPGRQPVRMMPIYIAGLAIVLIIGGFFYFQASKKKTETTYLVQKHQTETETQPVYHDRVPIDNTGDPKGLTHIPPEPPASTLLSQQELTEESWESVGQKLPKDQAESAVLSNKLAPAPTSKISPVPPKTPPAHEKQETASLSNLKALEVEIKESTAIEESDIKEPLVTAETDKSVTQERKAESPGVVEESKQSKPQKYKEILASKEKILSQQDQKDRLESFLRIYCRAYESKDLDKFASLFTPDATENNTPFQDMLPNYRKNMENIESFNYRIELVDYSLQNDTGNIRINGKYFTRFLLHEGKWEENSGSISMELITSGDSYLVKRLNYGK